MNQIVVRIGKDWFLNNLIGSTEECRQLKDNCFKTDK